MSNEKQSETVTEELKRVRDDLLELQAAARLVVANWERGDLAGSVNELGRLLPASSDDGSWPWCDACQSYHHPKNPTCFKLHGRQAHKR
jgi:hypothetical protein